MGQSEQANAGQSQRRNANARKAYVAPKLEKYGSIAELTRSGGSVNTEGASGKKHST